MFLSDSSNTGENLMNMQCNAMLPLHYSNAALMNMQIGLHFGLKYLEVKMYVSCLHFYLFYFWFLSPLPRLHISYMDKRILVLGARTHYTW